MDKYVKLQNVLETLKKANIGGYITDRLLEIPAADVMPVKHEKWIWDSNAPYRAYGAYYCTGCGCYVDFKENYCYNCGARMDGDTEGRCEK